MPGTRVFQFEWLEEGLWSIVVEADGYAAAPTRVTIDEDREDNRCVVELTQGVCVTLEFVGDRAIVDDVSGATLDAGFGATQSVTRSPGAAMRACGLCEGSEYRVDIVGSGRGIVAYPDTIAASADAHYRLRLGPGCRIRYVPDPEGGGTEAVVARVALADDAGKLVYAGAVSRAPRTLPHGAFRLTNLDDGRELATFRCVAEASEVTVPVRGWPSDYRAWSGR